MVTLLVDANLDGQAGLIDMRLNTDTWRELRDFVDLHLRYFDQVGLERTTSDDVVWRHCQAHGYCLLTANRNLESDDSLEATIRREGTFQSLPVFTLSDASGVYQSAAYLDDVVERLLEYLMDLDRYRGAGRLFLP